LVAGRELEAAVDDLDTLAFIAEGAARSLGARLAERGHAARRLRVTVHDERSDRHDLACDLREPRARPEELARGWRRLLVALAAQLQDGSTWDGEDHSLRIQAVEFAVPLAGPASPRQGTWLAPDGLEKTEAALERLIVRWGPDRVWRASVVEPLALLPEAAIRWDEGGEASEVGIKAVR
jgi:hypothetical protein